ncbi:pyrroline-5-carboxylate reductase family protein [Leucobacter sp. GX24907]
MSDQGASGQSFGDLRVAMLGLGSMNAAILRGLFTAGVRPENVIGTTNSAKSAAAKADALGIRVLSSEENANANVVAVEGADVVFVGVLPPLVGSVCAEIADAVAQNAVVVSVAAGVTVATLEGALRDGQPAVRTMPNTPLAVGSGSIGLSRGKSVTDAQVEMLRELFSPGGRVHVIDESMMDAFCGLAGSGPGYLYYVAQHMTAAGVELGFEPEVAAQLTIDTLLGAATIVQQEIEHDAGAAAALREEMVLPGGTTAAAFDVFDARDMGDAVRAGVTASAERTAAITRELAAKNG